MNLFRGALMTVALILGFFLAGCANNSQAESPAQTNKMLASYSDTRVFVTDKCVFGVNPPDTTRSLPGVLAASAIKVGINRLGIALRNAGSEKTFTTIRSTSAEISIGEPPACLYIVRGDFLTDAAPIIEDHKGMSHTDPACDTSWTRPLRDVALRLRAPNADYCSARELVGSGIYLSGPPKFFFEGKIKAAKNSDVLKIDASVLVVNSHLDRSLEKKGGALVLSFAIGEPGSGAPGADALSSTASVTQMIFGRVKAPLIAFYTGDSGPGAPWLKLAKMDGANKKPRVIWAARTETRDAREYLLFLADVLDDSEKDVVTGLQQTLISSERVKAELAAETAQVAARNAAEGKWIEAEIALQEYNDMISSSPQPSLAARRSKVVATRSLQREANLKAKQANLREYYPALLAIPQS